MTTPREAACQALLALATGAYAWGNVPTRRLKLWNDVPKETRPALFQFEGGTDAYAWTNTKDPKKIIFVKLFVYIAASDDYPGAPQINACADALDVALRPAGADAMLARNTLGGTCFNARIKGVPLKEPGDLDGDGILIVEVEIVLP